MKKTQILFLAVCLLAVWVPPAEAGYKIEVTTQPNFEQRISKLIIVTVECHESINCSDVERQVVGHVAAAQPGFPVVPMQLVKPKLLELGRTEYSADIRQQLADAFEADGILEIEVTHGQKGLVGAKGSESSASVKLVAPDGSILMFGEGSGRARNTLSSPENIARTVVVRILNKAFGW